MLNIQIFQPQVRTFSAASTTDLIIWIDDNLRAGNFQLLLNLHQVLFMDSLGLGGLIFALKRVQAAGGRMALCGLSGQTQMLLDATEMSRVFDIYGDPSEFEKCLMRERSPQS